MTLKRKAVRDRERKDLNKYGKNIKSIIREKNEAISKFRILFYFKVFCSTKMTLEKLVLFAKTRQGDGYTIARMCT